MALPRPGDPRGWGYVLNAHIEALEERVAQLEHYLNLSVGPQGPPGAGVAVDPIYTGLQVVYGPEPLPSAASMPNTVYVVLPPP